MKTLLLFLHDDRGQAARVAAAIDLADALRAHLLCVDVMLANLSALDWGGPVAAMVLEHDRADERRNRDAVAERLAARGLACSWVEMTGDVAEAIGDHAGLADLIVLSTVLPGGDPPDMVDTIRRVLRRVRTPVLAVPPGATGFHPGGNAIALWDGSADAETALRAAVPLLSRAGMVTILYVDDGSLVTPVRCACDYLRSHGIAAHATIWDKFAGAPQTIEQYIARHHPAYVVMGAFGHGRLHDAVFGSVTRHLLATATVPILLAAHG